MLIIKLPNETMYRLVDNSGQTIPSDVAAGIPLPGPYATLKEARLAHPMALPGYGIPMHEWLAASPRNKPKTEEA